MLGAHLIVKSSVRNAQRTARFKTSSTTPISTSTSTTNGSIATSALRSPVPAIGVFVGCCGFAFQVAVLYPWHEILGEQFKCLEKEVRGSRAELQSLKAAVLAGNEKIEELQAEVRDLKRSK